MSNGVTLTVRSPKFKVGDYVKWGDVYGYVKAGTGKIVKSYTQSLSLFFNKEGQQSSLFGWAYIIEDHNGKLMRSEAPENELSYLSNEEFVISLVEEFGVKIDKDKFYLEGYEKDFTVGSKGKVTITGYIK